MKRRIFTIISIMTICYIMTIIMPKLELPNNRLNNGKISVYYSNGYQLAAERIATKSQLWLEEMGRWLNINESISQKKVSIILGGWEPLPEKALASGHKTAGYYWRGLVFILNKDSDNPPVSHELGHWLMDQLADGNVPRWFTEGFAQYSEYELTGFSLPKPVLMPNVYISLYQLNEEFEDSENLLLAYWQAYRAFEAILEDLDWSGITLLLENLNDGATWHEAFLKVAGQDFDQWHEQWLKALPFFDQY